MANRRMFSRSIIESDLFYSLPVTAQNLYFHLALRGDDDGFVASPRTIMETVHATAEDLEQLRENGFVLLFPSGVVFIVHWLVHNQIRRDRYHPTLYQEEKTTLPVPLATEGREEQGKGDKDNPVQSGTDAEDTLDLEMFYSFWNGYPRKENLADARKVWLELHVDAELFEEIQNAVEVQKSSRKWTAEQGKYIPLPANWLRKEAWKDEPSVIQKSTVSDDFDWMNFTNELPE